MNITACFDRATFIFASYIILRTSSAYRGLHSLGAPRRTGAHGLGVRPSFTPYAPRTVLLLSRRLTPSYGPPDVVHFVLQDRPPAPPPRSRRPPLPRPRGVGGPAPVAEARAPAVPPLGGCSLLSHIAVPVPGPVRLPRLLAGVGCGAS